MVKKIVSQTNGLEKLDIKITSCYSAEALEEIRQNLVQEIGQIKSPGSTITPLISITTEALKLGTRYDLSNRVDRDIIIFNNQVVSKDSELTEKIDKEIDKIRPVLGAYNELKVLWSKNLREMQLAINSQFGNSIEQKDLGKNPTVKSFEYNTLFHQIKDKALELDYPKIDTMVDKMYEQPKLEKKEAEKLKKIIKDRLEEVKKLIDSKLSSPASKKAWTKLGEINGMDVVVPEKSGIIKKIYNLFNKNQEPQMKYKYFDTSKFTFVDVQKKLSPQLQQNIKTEQKQNMELAVEKHKELKVSTYLGKPKTLKEITKGISKSTLSSLSNCNRNRSHDNKKKSEEQEIKRNKRDSSLQR